MQSRLGNAVPMVKKEHCHSPHDVCRTPEKSSEITSAVVDDDNGQSFDNTSNQLVLYNPTENAASQDALVFPEQSVNFNLFPESSVIQNPSGRVLPSVGAFTVQCAACFKWRLIPTKEKYEEIRETILQEPFVCDRACEWRPDITCDDPEDISQDGSRLWAIDKPNIAQPPPGWERLLRIRGEGSTRFADIYYVAPSGKRLRSMVEIERYLLEHPEYIRNGVNLSQFSFLIPKPLQESYVRKRTRPMNPYDGGFGLPRPLEAEEVHPLSWTAPPTFSNANIIEPELSGHSPQIERPPCKKKGPATKFSSRPPFGKPPSSTDMQIVDLENDEDSNHSLDFKLSTLKKKKKKLAGRPLSKSSFDSPPASRELQVNDTGTSEHPDSFAISTLAPLKKMKKVVKRPSSRGALGRPPSFQDSGITGLSPPHNEQQGETTPSESPLTKNKGKMMDASSEQASYSPESNRPRIKIIGPHRHPPEL